MYKSKPSDSSSAPSGIPYIIGNEAAERFSFYGMKAALFVFLTQLGAGGIKPCVSAHVGDQFGENNKHMLPAVFNWFYFSINFGAVISNILIPWLLQWYGPHWAFGIPFIHVPPAGKSFTTEIMSKEGLRTLLKLTGIFAFVAIFWSLFDQTASTWVIQAQDMDLNFFGWELLPSQIQSANPFFILILIPIFTYIIYPNIEKVIPLTPLRKIGAGLFLTALSFSISAIIY